MPLPLAFSQCQGKKKLSQASRALCLVLSESICLGVAAWHLVTFPKFLTPSSPSHKTQVWQVRQMLQLGVRSQRSCCPSPQTGSILESENQSGFKLRCGPLGWKDIAGRSDEVFKTPATHHIRHSETSEREADGIGWGGHRQHEGQGRRQSAGEHDIERVEADGLGLERETVGRDDGSPHPRREGVAPILLLPLSEG